MKTLDPLSISFYLYIFRKLEHSFNAAVKISDINVCLMSEFSTLKKLARANLPANASTSTCGPLVKRPQMQFTCVTCSLHVKTGKFKFTCVYAASISRRIHTNCLQLHVTLPEKSVYFTDNFTYGALANSLAISMQNYLVSWAKSHANFKQLPTTAGRNTRNARQKIPPVGSKNTCFALVLFDIFLHSIHVKKSDNSQFPINFTSEKIFSDLYFFGQQIEQPTLAVHFFRNKINFEGSTMYFKGSKGLLWSNCVLLDKGRCLYA